MIKNFHTRGEFAKLNGITPFTLRLYDRMGLLKPAYVGENGYRYYTDDQAGELTAINLCVKAGFSLKEILQMKNQSPQPSAMLDLLVQIRERIEKQIAVYQACQTMADNMIYYHRGWEEHGLNRPFLQDGIVCRGFLSAPVDAVGNRGSLYSLEFVHFIEEKLGHPIEFPLSCLISAEKENSPVTRIFLRTTEEFDDPLFYYQPEADRYLIEAFQGTFDTIFSRLAQLTDYARSQNFFIAGPALATPVQRYLFASEDQEIVYVIGIPVKTC